MSTLNSQFTDGESAIGDWPLTPARLTGLYVLFGLGLLYLAYGVLPGIVTSEPLLARLQVAIGLGELLATAGLMYVLLTRSQQSLLETTEDLTATRQGLSVLQRVVRHNLRNDLMVVAGHADRLEDKLDQPQVSTHCTVIRDRCDALLTASEKIKLAAELNRTEADPEEVDLRATIRGVTTQLTTQYDGLDLSVSVPADATVLASPHIEFVFLELVENAIIHHDGSTPTIDIQVRDSSEYADWLTVTITDDGPGIPENELDAVGETEGPLEHGSGVGLWMVSWIVYQSGGEFEIENTTDGCRVTVALPAATDSNQQAKAMLTRLLA